MTHVDALSRAPTECETVLQVDVLDDDWLLTMQLQDPDLHTLLHIDHLGPFVKSKRGYTYVLAVSDGFTKYLIVKAVRNTKTLPVLQMLNEVSSYFGLPARIVTDRGTAYTSKQFAKYCDDNGVQHIKTAVRTPRANGQVERANQIILNYLRTTTTDPRDWDEQLPAVIDTDVNQPITEKRNLALTSMQEQRNKWKERFDRKHKEPTTYSVDDLVVVQHEPSATGESRKLEPKYRGPYVIAKVLGKDRYLLHDIDGMQVSQKRYLGTIAVAYFWDVIGL
ncbi:PREDICTED: uncharacterized protein LOC108376920 [Rhagoletis zephyria]|uniref:uncharacterized protein LOC108376920 n=1 Tax=Rhagoletis zephyria TaxID=28612 RepID=UPI0008113CA0|nr:PREDICTED: uncharacterized protein LOC108376920 [Rhagoletis zephyria]